MSFGVSEASQAALVALVVHWLAASLWVPQVTAPHVRDGKCPKDGILRTILWTAPRSGSSVFARSMMQRKDTEVLFERLFDSYYLGPENRSSNYFFEPEGMDIKTRTYDAIYDDLLSPLAPGKKLMFAKEMAYYFVPANISEQQEFTWPSKFDCFQHTFLLRSPATQVPSMVRVTLDEAEMLRKAKEESGEINLPFPEEMDLDEIGVQQLHFLFKYVAIRTGKTPVVVDINDLWNNPETVMKAYSEKIGVAYDPAVLRWEKGWREEFRYWDLGTEWMRDVLTSNGFLSEGSTQRKKGQKQRVAPALDPAVIQAMKEAEPLHAEMYPYRIGVQPDKVATVV